MTVARWASSRVFASPALLVLAYGRVVFDTTFGLPAHPLLIHAPLVLVPLAAILSALLAFLPSWRHRIGWWAVAALFVVVVTYFAAKQSGEALIEAYERVNGEGAVDIAEHRDLANAGFVLCLFWLVMTAVLTWFDRAEPLKTPSANRTGSQVLAGLMTAIAALATVWLIRAGHVGADLVWGPRVDVLFPSN